MLRNVFSSLILASSLVGAAAADASKKPNILFIAVDDLRPELQSFGADYITSPNIDALAARGVAFQRHYVQAPTCGASRYTLLTGQYGPSSNRALFARAEEMAQEPEAVPPSLPRWFRENGYTTVAVGKVSHHPGGRGGEDWDDGDKLEMPNSWDRELLPAGPWEHPRGWMHGLAHGEIREDPAEMDIFQAEAGDDSIYPDGRNTEEAMRELERLAGESDRPFFLAFGILRPHLPFGAPASYLEPYEDLQLPPTPHPEKPEGQTTWHGSGEFMRYNRWGKDPREDAAFAMEVRRHYAACVSYADAQVGKILERLDELGERDNTIVVLWGDHGWHLGEHAIWGKHSLFEESLRSPLIIHYPGMPHAGKSTFAVVETLDLFPTLVELSELPAADFVHGRSLVPILESPDEAGGHSAISYHRQARSLRTASHRLVAHGNGHLELYDHRTPEGETKNLAESMPELAEELRQQLEARLAN
jgi:iduronate 2-sulfatase